MMSVYHVWGKWGVFIFVRVLSSCFYAKTTGGFRFEGGGKWSCLRIVRGLTLKL